ncbi:MAG: hypothetical protein ABSB35_13610 [Bryobacteraceae bacterium]|jgi:hypothetical protein
MNYRRGFQRVYAVVTVVWVVSVLLFAPSERLRFWKVDQITQVQELMSDPKFQELDLSAQKAALAEIDPRFAQLSDEAYLPFRERMQAIVPPRYVRIKQLLWLMGVIVLPPAAVFVLFVYVVPWVYRGFS